MNELDKLFKDKLLDREFGFKDSYWQAAEQLIEQEERKRKRGGLWWRLGIFLLLLAATGYFLTDTSGTATVSAPGMMEAGQNGTEKTTQDPTRQDQDLSTAIPSNTSDRTDPDSAFFENRKAKTESQTPVQKKKQRSNKSTVQPSVSSYENNTSPDDSSNKGASLGNAPALDVQNVDVQLPALDTTVRQPAKKSKQKLEVAEKASTEEQIFSTNEIVTEELSPLVFKKSELAIPEADCEGCFEFVKLKDRPKGISFGLVAEGLYYPKGTSGKSWIGTSLGGSLQLYLGKKIAFRTGLQVAAIKYFGGINDEIGRYGNFSPLQESSESENQYSFGLRTVNRFYEPKSLVQLEVPLLVQLRHRRHAIETGVQLGLLLGVRGAQYTESSLYPWEQDAFETTADALITGSTGNEWISYNRFKKYTASWMFGYEFTISPRVAVNLGAYYNLGKNITPLVAKNLDSSLSNSTINEGRFHFRAGAKWYFKN